jgi:hypothetical protein
MPDDPRLPAVKRSAASRFSALVAALLVLFTWTGDAVGLHPCPHHSAVPAAAAPEHGGGHAADHGASAAAARHDPSSADHAEHGACTCVGCCPAGVALPVFAAPCCDASPVLPASPPVSADPGTGLPDRFPPFFLPYGLAPPALRA